MSDPVLTEKGNILPPEVWVTFWNIYDGGPPYLDGLSDKPWKPTYDAPITEYADNVRYVPADIHAARIADLTRQLAEAREVKPLEWSRESPYFVARVLGGHYSLEVWDAGTSLRGTFISGEYMTRLEAQAAAQADYTARILSALKGITPRFTEWPEEDFDITVGKRKDTP